MVKLKKYQVFVTSESNDVEELGVTYAISPVAAVEGVFKDIPIFYSVKLDGFVYPCSTEEPSDVHCHYEARAKKTKVETYWRIAITEVRIVRPEVRV